jgi:hypothetical protein
VNLQGKNTKKEKKKKTKKKKKKKKKNLQALPTCVLGLYNLVVKATLD